MVQHGPGRHQIKVSRLDRPGQDVALAELKPGLVRVGQRQIQIGRDRPSTGVIARPAMRTWSHCRTQLRASAPLARCPAARCGAGASGRAAATSAPAAGARLRGGDQGCTVARSSSRAPAPWTLSERIPGPPATRYAPGISPVACARQRHHPAPTPPIRLLSASPGSAAAAGSALQAVPGPIAEYSGPRERRPRTRGSGTWSSWLPRRSSRAAPAGVGRFAASPTSVRAWSKQAIARWSICSCGPLPLWMRTTEVSSP